MVVLFIQLKGGLSGEKALRPERGRWRAAGSLAGTGFAFLRVGHLSMKEEWA